MDAPTSRFMGAIAISCLFLAWACESRPPPDPGHILSQYAPATSHGPIDVLYPLDGSLFPPEIPAPTIRWRDVDRKVIRWVVGFSFQSPAGALAFDAFATQLTVPDEAWETVKLRTRQRDGRVTVLGLDSRFRIVTAGQVAIRTSEDEVGAPIFYREVNLPFIDAVKDPSRIRWRFGPVSSREPPPVVLENLPVCGNCHSFSSNGRSLGMDVDYANDKGSYAIVDVDKRIELDRSAIITWSDYARSDGEDTYGLLSQVSPDGKNVVSTVKDRSVFVARPGIEFSQLFFPVKGILAVYNRATQTFASLPGADDKSYVNSNPSWSPDGRTIAFTRAKAHPLKTERGKVLLSEEECKEFLKDENQFKFDIYQVPFNDGAGGEAAPIKGASGDGMSNYFPKYSPDGKWLVFCKAKSFSLLQKDSELYIVPGGGGKARRMRCNTPRMNSWHSWSPNGKWLVFSSKANSPYTQLYLTHIDEKGNDTPPVLLDRLTKPDRAANIPEFVNLRPDAITSIEERFVDDLSFIRAAQEFSIGGDTVRAIEAYRKALTINPRNQKAHLNLGVTLDRSGQTEAAVEHYRAAAEIDPNDKLVWFNLGATHEKLGRPEEAVDAYLAGLRIEPDDPETHYNLGVAYNRLEDAEKAAYHYQEAIRLDATHSRAHNNLGSIHQEKGRFPEAERHFRLAIELDINNASARNNLGTLLMLQGKVAEAVPYYEQAIRIDPSYARAHSNLGAAMQRLNRKEEAARHYRKALRLDPNLEQARHNLNILLKKQGR